MKWVGWMLCSAASYARVFSSFKSYRATWALKVGMERFLILVCNTALRCAVVERGQCAKERISVNLPKARRHWEGGVLGQPADLNPKGAGDQSMPAVGTAWREGPLLFATRVPPGKGKA